ncbi:hypothetical protein NDU88_002676 [Pleurodeles waltl]|uniref:Uncharacterized protein n=1 Tax=Pleurodeles waltl TaxID=8319 RepID=A0AAV7UWV2_PLEWA|nr:hypothetical protein NDU88_002676 [Pleurodeles waltl]
MGTVVREEPDQWDSSLGAAGPVCFCGKHGSDLRPGCGGTAARSLLLRRVVLGRWTQICLGSGEGSERGHPPSPGACECGTLTGVSADGETASKGPAGWWQVEMVEQGRGDRGGPRRVADRLLRYGAGVRCTRAEALARRPAVRDRERAWVRAVESKNGGLCETNESMAEAFAAYYEKFCASVTRMTEEDCANLLRAIPLLGLVSKERDVLDAELSEEEVTAALWGLQSGKVVGPNGLQIELFK